ncbi:universal stress protein [Lutimaribacter marinistellae]|uniref:Universal stress protein n=1 Tax=Lutimaribacter marinistellae TaxID=1820329 RepID=A0ABV7TKC0_9RHOB
MYSRIMVPVDIAHPGGLSKALGVAADLAMHYGAEICYVAVSSSAPGDLGHNPEEARTKLAHFAAAQGEAHGHAAKSHLAISHDPAVDLDRTLLKAVQDTGADLVIMASHVPAWSDFLRGSHGGHMANHAKCSVMIVRDS